MREARRGSNLAGFACLKAQKAHGAQLAGFDLFEGASPYRAWIMRHVERCQGSIVPSLCRMLFLIVTWRLRNVSVLFVFGIDHMSHARKLPTAFAEPAVSP